MNTAENSEVCPVTIEAENSRAPIHMNVSAGTTLLQCIRSLPNAPALDAACNGSGRCGKCKIRASGCFNPPTHKETELLSRAEIERGIRLACQTTVHGSAVIYLNTDTPQMAIVTEGKQGAVRETQGNGTKKPVFGLAIDIGTTTVVLYLCDLANGKLCLTQGFPNPQRLYGADVISRIHAVCRSPELLSVQRNCLLREIAGQLDTLCTKHQISCRDLTRIVLTGNTVMLHFMMEISPCSMSAYPFRPVSLFGTFYPVAALGLPTLSKYAEVYIPPCFSAFAGADISTGLLYAEIPDALDKKQTALYLDIGTNCEIALAYQGKLFLCSTAAGPAFEGGGISCGMPSVAGAVDHVETDGTAIRCTTIGGQSPIGFCGSGLVDAAAVLLKTDMLTKDGRLKSAEEVRDPFCSMLRSENGQNAFAPFSEHSCSITARDMRELQTAKAAVRAAVDTLLNICKVSPGELEVVYLAGGFGSRMNPASAARIGLLPAECFSKLKILENAAGAGAVGILLHPEKISLAEKLQENADTVELSNTEFFARAFLGSMNFPTEIEASFE